MRNHDIPEGEPGQYRDHLLFWPIGQELFMKVARSLLDDAQIGSDRINVQWRVCFRWTDDGPHDVEIVDYH